MASDVRRDEVGVEYAISDLDRIERDAIEKLDELRREYELRSRPYVDIVVKVRSMRPPPPLILTADFQLPPHFRIRGPQ